MVITKTDSVSQNKPMRVNMALDEDKSIDDIRQIITLTNQMLSLVDLGEAYKVDEKRAIFYRAVRDSAFRLRRMAKNELNRYESEEL